MNTQYIFAETYLLQLRPTTPMVRHWQMPVSAAQTLAWLVHLQAEMNDKLTSHHHYNVAFSNKGNHDRDGVFISELNFISPFSPLVKFRMRRYIKY